MSEAEIVDAIVTKDVEKLASEARYQKSLAVDWYRYAQEVEAAMKLLSKGDA